LSIGSEARIGGGEKYEIYVSNTCHNDVTAREQNKNQGSVVKASSCKLWDSGTTESLQSFFFDTQSNKAGTGSVQCQKKPNPSECQQFMTRVMHKQLPDNACVINVPSSMCDDHNPKPTPAPAPPAPAPAKLEKCDHNYGGQCFHLGKDFECQNTAKALGANPDYRCVNTKPAPAPAPPAPAAKKCNPNQNPTYTPECPSGFTCKAILGSGKKNDGQCIKDSKPAPTPAKPVTCDPKNPVNPDFDCTQKVGPRSKCQYHWDPVKYQVWECTEDHHHITD
jgi:hypothetical protein